MHVILIAILYLGVVQTLVKPWSEEYAGGSPKIGAGAAPQLIAFFVRLQEVRRLG